MLQFWKTIDLTLKELPSGKTTDDLKSASKNSSKDFRYPAVAFAADLIKGEKVYLLII